MKHGSNSGYSLHKCRCELCLKWKSDENHRTYLLKVPDAKRRVRVAPKLVRLKPIPPELVAVRRGMITVWVEAQEAACAPLSRPQPPTGTTIPGTTFPQGARSEH
jgi:hypothetical protein